MIVNSRSQDDILDNGSDPEYDNDEKLKEVFRWIQILMGMKLRNYHGSLVKTHLTYEVFREDGSKLCQCGTLEDIERCW